MLDIPGFPCLEAEFDKEGRPLGGAAARAADFVAANGITDLFVISHGWNNDMDDARDLYRRFFGFVRAALDGGAFPDLARRKFGVLAILWPSKKFADSDLIPGGAASAGGAISVAAIQQHLDRLKGVFDQPGADAALEQAKGLVPQLENSTTARRQFVDLVRSALKPGEADHEDQAADNKSFFTKDGEQIMQQLQKPILAAGPGPGGGAAGPGGGAAGIGDVIGGIRSGISSVTQRVQDGLSGMRAGAERLLNYATYYQMKDRAGTVGRTGVYQVLTAILAKSPGVRMHLIGHSFGGRLVTSAAMGPDGRPPIRPASMTLLQAAFSHNGFASRFDGTRDGFFRRVVADGLVPGPILITHSVQDEAVGLAYPLASRIAGQDAAALGDAHDRYGGIGRNGAQFTPEAGFGPLLAAGGPYTFKAGRVYNLNGDKIIAGHSDICRPEVAAALLAAVSSS
jgi:hypothetical protein